MSSNQFYFLLFGLSLFGGLSFMLLVEVCKLRHFLNGIQSGLKEQKRISGWLSSESELQDRAINDLQLIASVHESNSREHAKRLKLLESPSYFLARPVKIVVAGDPAGNPAEVHPFAADAFVTVPAEAAAA